MDTILTNTRRIQHLESFSASTFERSNDIHAQLIAPVLTSSAFVDIIAPRAIVLVVSEALAARAHSRAVLLVANLLAAAVIIATRIHVIARLVP